MRHKFLFGLHVLLMPLIIRHMKSLLLITILQRNLPSGYLVAVRRVALELGHYRVDKMVVHRLDMATSGVVVMARSDAALKSLNQQASV